MNLSVAILNDAPCGTEITAIVSEALETIEQYHWEYVKVANLNSVYTCYNCILNLIVNLVP